MDAGTATEPSGCCCCQEGRAQGGDQECELKSPEHTPGDSCVSPSLELDGPPRPLFLLSQLSVPWHLSEWHSLVWGVLSVKCGACPPKASTVMLTVAVTSRVPKGDLALSVNVLTCTSPLPSLIIQAELASPRRG